LYIFNMSESKYISQYAMKEPFYMGNKDSGSGVYNWSGSKYFPTYNPVDPIHFGGGSGSYFNLTTGSNYFAQYNMKEPLYMGNKDSGSGVYNWSGSKYFSTYNSIDPIYFGGDSGSYFNLTTGSKYISQYNMKEPLYMGNKDSGSGVHNWSGSKYFATYNPIDPIYFGGGSGSYFNLTTGSKYFGQYNMKEPLYYYHDQSSSAFINFTSSGYSPQYNPIDSIYFGGGSGSYFNLTTGSKYFTQYDMIYTTYKYHDTSGSAFINMTGSYKTFYEPTEPIYFGGGSGSYFNLTTGSKYFPVYTEGTITAPSSSGATGDWADIEINNANREIANMGLLSGIRRFRDGSQFTTGSATGNARSYIWDAWGTGSNDVWFMAGSINSSGIVESVNKGYYNKEFTFKVMGDIETLLQFSVEREQHISASTGPDGIGFNSEYTTGTGIDKYDINYSNLHHFKNKIIVDTGEGYQHKGYYTTGSNPGVDSS